MSNDAPELDDVWYKLLALVMHMHGLMHIVVRAEDIEMFMLSDYHGIVVIEGKHQFVIQLVSREEEKRA